MRAILEWLFHSSSATRHLPLHAEVLLPDYIGEHFTLKGAHKEWFAFANFNEDKEKAAHNSAMNSGQKGFFSLTAYIWFWASLPLMILLLCKGFQNCMCREISTGLSPNSLCKHNIACLENIILCKKSQHTGQGFLPSLESWKTPKIRPSQTFWRPVYLFIYL